MPEDPHPLLTCLVGPSPSGPSVRLNASDSLPLWQPSLTPRKEAQINRAPCDTAQTGPNYTQNLHTLRSGIFSWFCICICILTTSYASVSARPPSWSLCFDWIRGVGSSICNISTGNFTRYHSPHLRCIHSISLSRASLFRSAVRGALTGSVVSSLRVIPCTEAIVLKQSTRNIRTR